jgi:hypothetical protein
VTPDDRREQLYDVLVDACDQAGLEEGVIVMLDPVTTEAHISVRGAGHVRVAQKALYALASYLESVGGNTGRSWPHQDDG